MRLRGGFRVGLFHGAVAGAAVATHLVDMPLEAAVLVTAAAVLVSFAGGTAWAVSKLEDDILSLTEWGDEDAR